MHPKGDYSGLEVLVSFFKEGYIKVRIRSWQSLTFKSSPQWRRTTLRIGKVSSVLLKLSSL